MMQRTDMVEMHSVDLGKMTSRRTGCLQEVSSNLKHSVIQMSVKISGGLTLSQKTLWFIWYMLVHAALILP